MISTVWFHFSVHMGKSAGKKVNFMTTSSDNAFKKSHQSHRLLMKIMHKIFLLKWNFSKLLHGVFIFLSSKTMKNPFPVWEMKGFDGWSEVIKRICFCLKFHEKLGQKFNEAYFLIFDFGENLNTFWKSISC